MASAAVYDDIEQDAGNYMIGTNTPQVSASVLKKSSQNQSGPNFNVPSKLEVSLSRYSHGVKVVCARVGTLQRARAGIGIESTTKG